jgi:polysaccharide export outer membrane protein
VIRPLLVPALVVAAVLAPAFAAAQEAPEPRAHLDEYVIGPEDILDISVWDNEQISRTVPVRPDGRISLPLLNDVHAAGLTPMRLRDVLAALLVPYMPVASVSVIVREVHSFKVTVLGEVRTAGRYDLKSPSTVLDLIAMAGGLTEYASRSRIVVLRREGKGRRQIPFTFDRLQDNFDVEPDDIILVP